MVFVSGNCVTSTFYARARHYCRCLTGCESPNRSRRAPQPRGRVLFFAVKLSVDTHKMMIKSHGSLVHNVIQIQTSLSPSHSSHLLPAMRRNLQNRIFPTSTSHITNTGLYIKARLPTSETGSAQCHTLSNHPQKQSTIIGATLGLRLCIL